MTYSAINSLKARLSKISAVQTILGEKTSEGALAKIKIHCIESSDIEYPMVALFYTPAFRATKVAEPYAFEYHGTIDMLLRVEASGSDEEARVQDFMQDVEFIISGLLTYSSSDSFVIREIRRINAPIRPKKENAIGEEDFIEIAFAIDW